MPTDPGLAGVVDTILEMKKDGNVPVESSDDEEEEDEEEEDDEEEEEEEEEEEVDEDGKKKKKKKKQRPNLAKTLGCPNTAKIRDAMEAVVEDKSGNSETGANFLRKLVSPEFDFETYHDTNNDEEILKSETENDELLRVTAIPPDDRTAEDLSIIAKELGLIHFLTCVAVV